MRTLPARRKLLFVTEFILFLTAAIFLAIPSLLVAGVLALRRSTRYFVLPLVAGLLAGAAAAALPGPIPAIMSFVIAFGVVAAPLVLVCGLVALIARAERRSPDSNLPRNAFAVVLALVAVALIGEKLDRPAAEPTARFTGVVRNLSVAARDDGMVEDRADVALDDGRSVRAVSIRALRPMAASDVITFPARFEPQRVRVDEYRSVITGRRTYTFTAIEGSPEKN